MLIKAIVRVTAKVIQMIGIFFVMIVAAAAEHL
jgi:hypothetical protein